MATELIDGEEMLIKDPIPENAPSVCIEDFCGSDGVGPVSFSADYFPEQRITRFTGIWWNVPDLPGDQPTLEQVHAWAAANGEV
jgi:hypothetical protein